MTPNAIPLVTTRRGLIRHAYDAVLLLDLPDWWAEGWASWVYALMQYPELRGEA